MMRWSNGLETTVGVVGLEEWLWIAWIFGEEEIFNTVVEYLTHEATITV